MSPPIVETSAPAGAVSTLISPPIEVIFTSCPVVSPFELVTFLYVTLPAHRRAFHVARHVFEQHLAAHRRDLAVDARLLERDVAAHRREIERALQVREVEPPAHRLAAHVALDAVDFDVAAHRFEQDVGAARHLDFEPHVRVVAAAARAGVARNDLQPLGGRREAQVDVRRVLAADRAGDRGRVVVPARDVHPAARLQLHVEALARPQIELLLDAPAFLRRGDRARPRRATRTARRSRPPPRNPSAAQSRPATTSNLIFAFLLNVFSDSSRGPARPRKLPIRRLHTLYTARASFVAGKFSPAGAPRRRGRYRKAPAIL